MYIPREGLSPQESDDTCLAENDHAKITRKLLIQLPKLLPFLHTTQSDLTPYLLSDLSLAPF